MYRISLLNRSRKTGQEEEAIDAQPNNVATLKLSGTAQMAWLN